MKKILFIAAIASLVAVTSAQAQTEVPKEKKEQRERKGGSMYDDLNLSQDQKDKIKVIEDDRKAKMNALRADESTSKEQKMEKFKALSKESSDKIKAILTPEQKVKYEAKMKERQARAGSKRGE